VNHLDEGTRSDARTVLSEVLEWQASAEEWEFIAKLVDAVTNAVANNDAAAVQTAIVDLDYASPTRVPPINKSAKQSPPQEIRERVNHLVHSLGDCGKDAEKNDNGPGK
jgi:hypothetical protein